MTEFSYDNPYSPGNHPLFSRNVVATSHPLAVMAGLRILKEGGNAVDAAIGTAITLTVVEPNSNGLGGDAFCLIWRAGELIGVNGSGASPSSFSLDLLSPENKIPEVGMKTITVPGAVQLWQDIHELYGKIPFERLFNEGIHYAEKGFPVSKVQAYCWRNLPKNLLATDGFKESFFIDGKNPPKEGGIFKFPDQAKTLKEISKHGADVFYRGGISEQFTSYFSKNNGFLTASDLAAHRSRYVKPLTVSFKGYEVHGLPPNGQGIATLMALGILENIDFEKISLDSPLMYHYMIEAMKLAFEDTYKHVSDPKNMKIEPKSLLKKGYLKELSKRLESFSTDLAKEKVPKDGGTVLLCAGDQEGNMVSFIQSNYCGFGSGVVVPGTGVSFHNRGLGFNTVEGHPNCYDGNKKPFHTIIPGFVTKDDEPIMAFGCMGGSMQPQGQLQLIIRTLVYGQNPQTASDAPRFRVKTNNEVWLEKDCTRNLVDSLAEMGHQIKIENPINFGGAQLIWRSGSNQSYISGSDHRKDGLAMGY